MNELLSQRVRHMASSATLAMAARAAELRAQGIDIVNLSLGEPDLAPPALVLEAAHMAIEQGYHKYSPVDGYKELREAICRKFERDNKLHYTPEQIVVSNGAKQCLANIALALLDDGDEAILPAPYWVSYADLIKLAGGRPVEIRTHIESDFKITPEQLESAITPHTKMLWFSSPCNPTGTVYSRAELEALAQVLAEHPDIFVVSDEIYEHIRFGSEHASMASIEGMYERTITVNGLSKAYAMTGWRIGFMGAPHWIAKACAKIQGQMTSGANSIAQRAAIAALDAPLSVVRPMVDEFEGRRDLMLRGLGQIDGIRLNRPEGAFYIFADVSAFFGHTLHGRYIGNTSDMAMYLLEEARVATVAGQAFGDNKCIRLSYATDRATLEEALRRITQALS